MATQIPPHVDSHEPEIIDKDGDLEMKETIEDGSAINGSAWRSDILQNVKRGDGRHGSFDGKMSSDHVLLYLPHPQRDLFTLVSVKKDVLGFFTGPLEHLKWIRRPEKDLFEAMNRLLERGDTSLVRDDLAIASFSKKQEYPGIRYAVQSTPTDLYGDYDCILHRINSKDRHNSLSVLKWLVFSERPLTLDEMAVATAETRRRRQSKPDVKAMEDLVQVWEPFLVIHEGKVFFVHSKAKEYMKERGLVAQWLVELASKRAKRRRVK